MHHGEQNRNDDNDDVGVENPTESLLEDPPIDQLLQEGAENQYTKHDGDLCPNHPGNPVLHVGQEGRPNACGHPQDQQLKYEPDQDNEDPISLEVLFETPELESDLFPGALSQTTLYQG